MKVLGMLFSLVLLIALAGLFFFSEKVCIHNATEKPLTFSLEAEGQSIFNFVISDGSTRCTYFRPEHEGAFVFEATLKQDGFRRGELGYFARDAGWSHDITVYSDDVEYNVNQFQDVEGQ